MLFKWEMYVHTGVGLCHKIKGPNVEMAYLCPKFYVPGVIFVIRRVWVIRDTLLTIVIKTEAFPTSELDGNMSEASDVISPREKAFVKFTS